MRVTGPAFCAAFCVFIFSSALADDYKRKDYLESYERTYERSQKKISAPHITSEPSLRSTQDNSPSNSSYDEYSLYEWTKQRPGAKEAGPEIKNNSIAR